MFVAGDIESNPKLIEQLYTVMEGARVGACLSRGKDAEPIRLGSIQLRGPGLPREREEDVQACGEFTPGPTGV
ncbi:MAG: hypothetical protein R3185_09485 [Candidatus Thermoplasmatota archaeon]|nr:hypothetical protein [Candidatus Thermoplasmatota archaeon]